MTPRRHSVDLDGPGRHSVRHRSGLIVEVPEAEPAVASWRAQLDPHAKLGVPAHVTILFPFAPPASIDTHAINTLHRLFATVTSFDYHLVDTSWFDDNVLWLAPDAASEFRMLTDLVSSAFPDYPPYGGKFPEVVPHLTVADHGPAHHMQAAERQVREHLPIRSTARSVSLMIELPTRRWERAATFPFA